MVYYKHRKEVSNIELKDILTITISIWSNVVATITLIQKLRDGKRKTAPKYRPKHMRKR